MTNHPLTIHRTNPCQNPAIFAREAVEVRSVSEWFIINVESFLLLLLKTIMGIPPTTVF